MNESHGFRTYSSGATATVTWTDKSALVTLTGEFDACFSPSGASIIRLLADQDKPVEVDLSGVTLLCAAGVSWLVSLSERVRPEVRVVAASDPVIEVLALCEVPTHLPSRARADSLAEA